MELQKTVLDSDGIRSEMLFELAFKTELTLLDIDRISAVLLDYLDSIA